MPRLEVLHERGGELDRGPGGSDELIETDYITVYQTVVANFSVLPASGIAPLSLTFLDASTGSITDWEWDFENDGTVDSYVRLTYTLMPGHILSSWRSVAPAARAKKSR